MVFFPYVIHFIIFGFLLSFDAFFFIGVAKWFWFIILSGFPNICWYIEYLWFPVHFWCIVQIWCSSLQWFIHTFMIFFQLSWFIHQACAVLNSSDTLFLVVLLDFYGSLIDYGALYNYDSFSYIIFLFVVNDTLKKVCYCFLLMHLPKNVFIL